MIYTKILNSKSSGKKIFCVLIDPDKHNNESLLSIIHLSNKSKIDLFLVGGSLITKNNLKWCVNTIKKESKIEIVLFPGNTMQINENADAILFLSLISGRNPDLLIGNQVISAPILKQSKIEVISTGYMLIDSGEPTSSSYISGTMPIPHNKDDISMSTALAGEMLGMKLIYMDAGSGSKKRISLKMIQSVSKNIKIPLIIGGGITNEMQAVEICQAGADVIVVGNAIEENHLLINKISNALHKI
tara:strand:- start:70515 stop:71249 length:735 start_codon:yes stop_codon:yes gene_type:complete